jgi:hypothetical protein
MTPKPQPQSARELHSSVSPRRSSNRCRTRDHLRQRTRRTRARR